MTPLELATMIADRLLRIDGGKEYSKATILTPSIPSANIIAGSYNHDDLIREIEFVIVQSEYATSQTNGGLT
jgi:hypothetical protein